MEYSRSNPIQPRGSKKENCVLDKYPQFDPEADKRGRRVPPKMPNYMILGSAYPLHRFLNFAC
jgi:hypothetical protein